MEFSVGGKNICFGARFRVGVVLVIPTDPKRIIHSGNDKNRC